MAIGEDRWNRWSVRPVTVNGEDRWNQWRWTVRTGEDCWNRWRWNGDGIPVTVGHHCTPMTDYADTSLSVKRAVPRAYFSSQQPVKTALLISAELSQQLNTVVDTVSMDIVKLYTRLPSFQEENFYMFSSSSVFFLFGATAIWSKSPFEDSLQTISEGNKMISSSTKSTLKSF